jgi:outer membrane protein insertion porin family
MKKDESVSTFASGNGTSKKPAAALFVLLVYALLFPRPSLHASPGFNNHTIDEVYLKVANKIESYTVSPYRLLLHIKKGDSFNYKAVRQSMENLYKVGSFDSIEVKVQEKENKRLDVYFLITNKYRVDSIKIREISTADTMDPGVMVTPISAFSPREVEKAIFSLREQDYFDQDRLNDAISEARQFLNSRGYFNPLVTYKVIKNHKRFTAAVRINIEPGGQAKVNKINAAVSRPELQPKIRELLQTRTYIPYKFKENIDDVKEFLKKHNYYFPAITIDEQFTGDSRRSVNLDVTVDPGPRYVFQFEGMKKRVNLIASIWEKKVFEKWAEKESKARILYFLKNKGYLDARVKSKITEKDSTKIITFYVTKNKRYKLGNIEFEGDTAISEKVLRHTIRTDDLAFEKFFYLRLSSLLVDREILGLLYYFQGYPSARIFTEPDFHGKRVDIRFVIEEGKRYTIESILFEGNRFFAARALLEKIQSKASGPFVEQKINEDIERIKGSYHENGFDNIKISAEITPGTEKAVLIRIDEGKAFKMGSTVIIGASSQQRKLIAKLFPIAQGEPFNQLKIDAFEQEIENSSIFNHFKIVKIEREPDILDVLIKADPDYSKYYGFGVGWESGTRFRGTLEYQGRNVFKSYSSFSSMFQAGPYEMRGVLSYDTPYFFKTRTSSSLKLWVDNEIYPSYKFNRWGVAGSLIKKIQANSYFMGSLSWYRTTLTELEITPQGVDRLDVPFDTTAFGLSYVREGRDDPFNPREGSFFSSDLKIGLPVFEKDYIFVKLRCNFQENFKLLRSGVLTFSLRGGLAYGDLSITERFFAGGPHSFRGVRTDRLSPIDPITGSPMGGDALLLVNLEATFPLLLIPINGLYYSIYTDIGNVFEEIPDIGLKHMKKAVGVSLKWKIPLGLLWGGVAWNLDPYPGANPVILVLGIGNVF